MTKKNQFDFASEDERQKFLKEIIDFFQSERNQEIGLLAAEDILNFFTESLGPEIYKKAIDDCKKLLKERILDFETELDMLVPSK